MAHTNNQMQETKKTTEEEVPVAQSALITFAVLLLLALIGYFWIYAKHLPSNLPVESKIGIGDWGAFGDFMGGLLNPAVAFAAFYWLTQSVKLQKTELTETRKILDVTAKAQEEQVKNGYTSIRLAAATAIVNTLQSDIGSIEREIEQINIRESTPLIAGVYSTLTSAGRMMALYERKDRLTKKRDELISEMTFLISEAQTQSQPSPPL